MISWTFRISTPYVSPPSMNVRCFPPLTAFPASTCMFIVPCYSLSEIPLPPPAAPVVNDVASGGPFTVMRAPRQLDDLASVEDQADAAITEDRPAGDARHLSHALAQ